MPPLDVIPEDPDDLHYHMFNPAVRAHVVD
jgi:hypothetical protein